MLHAKTIKAVPKYELAFHSSNFENIVLFILFCISVLQKFSNSLFTRYSVKSPSKFVFFLLGEVGVSMFDSC